jgi:hypothetical protein
MISSSKSSNCSGGGNVSNFSSSCEDNLHPQLDQGNEEVIRVTLLTFGLKRQGQIGNVGLSYFT